MITVTLFSQDSFLKGYTVEGHAEMADPGEDIVCAGVSALAQTALLGLDAFLTTKPVWKIENDGYMECWLADNLTATEQEAARIILQTMELGLRNMKESYGKYLKVSKRRWIPCCSK